MFIKIDDINYHIQIKGEGNPLICLHGFSENLNTWDNIDVRGYKMILIDLIGHGNSDKPISRKYYHVNYIVKHLNKLITKLGFNKYSILGYSMGGRIALSYALTYPSDIDKLILESTSYGVCGLFKRIKRRKSDKTLAKSIINNGIRWFDKYWSSLSIFDSQKNLSDTVKDEIKLRRLNNKDYALHNSLLKNGQGTYPCYKNLLSKLTMEVLHISGEYDKKYVQIGYEFANANLNIKQIILKCVGHNTHIEDPLCFNEILNNFL